jgi:formate dehydrogenase subunit gamma
MATARRRPRDARIPRFSVAERLLHWLLAGAFFVLLGTGFLMSVPALSGEVARPVAKEWHIDAAIALAVGVALLMLVQGKVLTRTISQLERFDRDDLRWLGGTPRRVVSATLAPPQGRFNAGQKLNTALVAGLMVISYITGALLWLGERDTTYRFAGTISVHDGAMWALMVLVAGHIYMAMLNPSTSAALAGMLRGSVDRTWALRHHAKWVADLDRAADVEAAADPKD